MPSSSSNTRTHPAGRPKAPSLPARSAAAADSLQDLVGKKVSILYRLEDDSHPFNEVVGVVQRVELAASGGGQLTIRKRDGTVIEVFRSTIITMKIVPT